MIQGSDGCGVEGCIGCGAIQATRGCGSQSYDVTKKDNRTEAQIHIRDCYLGITEGVESEPDLRVRWDGRWYCRMCLQQLQVMEQLCR